MQRLIVDADRLSLALTSSDTPSFLDLETGDVSLFGFYTTLSPEEYEQYAKSIFSNPIRYLRITPLLAEAWDELVGEFQSRLSADDALLLKRTIESDEVKPRREFMKAKPELFQKWMEYREMALIKLAQKWLESHQIEAGLISSYEA